ncbi:MAG TPA: 4Fe-4S double cluster binding domain-containing protein [Methanocella sp.]|uniref:4Fe-4S double cluster binding domain-containing protein n=1 Tax=Methanocella sp. TaxID=2052833 RepID=UPI002D1C9C89|nr:4Fe-4S double cluster binding domain-containing protein [Methanocella sp.]HTY90652.1 4Fe-4S double cluster binding domain-containing protein [Methanocella sp.]
MSVRLEEHGLSARIVPISRLDDLRQGFDGLIQQGLIDEGLNQEYLKRFVYRPPEGFSGAMSVIVMASRMPAIRFSFIKNEVKIPVYIPPTYIHGARYDRKAQDTLAELLTPYKVTPAVLPKKLLAVRSGLAAYGRNNITYIEGLGSCYWLSAFYTDMPCAEEGTWREPTMMESCNDCSICRDNCPTGAIVENRFLLHAERCIVFHNEMPGNVPFPSWMDETWHNSLVGCLYCQEYCPENKGMIDIVDGAEFSREETELLLAGTPEDKLPAPLVKKLEECDLLSILDIIPRNLTPLLH